MISSQDRIKEFVATGNTNPVPLNFPFASAADIAVTAQDGDDAPVDLTLNADYSIGGTVAQWRAGAGTIVPIDIAAGLNVRCERRTALVQSYDPVAGIALDHRALGRTLDDVTMRAQDAFAVADDLQGRAIMLPRGEVAIVLPAAAARAGYHLAFNADGDLMMSAGTGADAGLRTDLASDDGGSMVKTERGVTIETELIDRGTVIDAQTLTAPLVLAPGKHHVGLGQAGWVVMSNRASGLVTAQPAGGGFDQYGVNENLFIVHSGTFADCGDYARDISYSGYGFEQNNRYWGGQVAAVRVRNSVGYMSINEDTARSPIGHLFEIVTGIQSTVHQLYGGSSNILGTAIKSIGRIDFLSIKSRAFDHFNDLIADAGPVYNLHFDTCWFEEYGHGTVEFLVEDDEEDPDFGRVTGYAVHSGAGDKILRLGSSKGARFTACIFVQAVTLHGGFAPIFEAPHCTGGDFYVQRNGVARGVYHMRHLTGPNSGTVGVDEGGMTLPEYGEAGTLLEHYGVSSANTSMAIAEISGVAHAAGMGHTNLYTSEMDGAVWATKTATLTPGRPDPWGGTTAFGFSGTPGQFFSNYYIPELDGGQQYCMAFLVRAQAIDNVIALRMASTGLNQYQRLLRFHFTDTRWRVIVLRGDLPAAGNYTTSIEIVNGAFDIAASQLTLGYDLKPLLRGGQSVTGAFTQVDRRIVKRGTAIPVAGKWWAGDEIVYDAATAATRKRRGALCTVGDGTGVGTWIEHGIVANPAAAIASPTADVNDLKTAVDAIRDLLSGVELTA